MNWRWIILMAWRDSRKNRSRLFLFISSIILGIASLVAMNSFNDNLKRDIDVQAAQLIGADLELESRRKPDDETLAFIDSIQGLSEQMAKEERFMSMLRFLKDDGSRFVQVRGISGNFPFYGEVETSPEDVYADFNTKQEVLVEKTLMMQFNAQAGDRVQLGLSQFDIGATLLAQPGQTAIRGAMAPTVFVPLDALAQSGLQQTGSRIEYHYYFKFPAGYPVDELITGLKDRLTELQLQSATISTTKENTGRSFSDMASFMELVSFVALLLGCIGVSSAVHIYVREKLVSVSILRCLGASSKQAFYIFLIQFAAIGFLGGLVGAALGTLIQYLIPLVMQDIVPVALSSAISWAAIGKGIALGVVIAVLFALLPLISVRHISPLNSLRVSDQPEELWKDKFRWLIYALIVAFIVGFARLQLNDWMQTLFFTIAIGITFFLLYGIAHAVTFLVKKYFPSGWPYVWRQGLSNLYRPNNQTIVLLISIGFGTALIATLFFVQDMLMQRVKMASSENQANMVLFDIQTSQIDSLKQLTLDMGLPIMDEVPIVTMQISSINELKSSDVMKDSTSAVSGRIFRSEIRATYRDSLTQAEKVTAGKWVGQVAAGETAQVSFDKNYAEETGVKIGDKLVFNVQGVSVPAVVSSFREVDWNRFQSNFRVVFAKGAIDQAPQTYLLMTKTADEQKSSAYQQAVVKQFANVSVIDVNTVLRILDDILKKIGFVIQFIGAFSILTGVVVLISSVRVSKFQRIRENVLLRTLGASRKQILTITVSEYLFLGILASVTGVLIALIASNLLAVFVFETAFIPSFAVIVLLTLAVSALTILIGMLNSRSVLNSPPLEVLRRD